MTKEALKQVIDLIQPVAALTDRTPFENSEVIQRCVDATEIALEALAQPAQEPQVCCGEYDTCLRACTPRGRYLAQPDERNFCPRCGKRTADLTTIHTCTPPREKA